MDVRLHMIWLLLPSLTSSPAPFPLDLSIPSKQDFYEFLKHATLFHLKLCTVLSPWSSHFPSPPLLPPGQHCNFILFILLVSNAILKTVFQIQ